MHKKRDIGDLLNFNRRGDCHATELRPEDVEPTMEDITTQEADLFQPAPTHWKQIMALPLHLRSHWARSFKTELNTLLNMKTFALDEKPAGEPIIPVTAKFRAKLKSNGSVKKLKTRICLRENKQQELTEWDTWCLIDGFRELRKFLAYNASVKQRIYQLDFIGAFLQSQTQHLTYTMLPQEWAELVPEHSEWFGKPLKLVKALYGDTTANKC